MLGKMLKKIENDEILPNYLDNHNIDTSNNNLNITQSDMKVGDTKSKRGRKPLNQAKKIDSSKVSDFIKTKECDEEKYVAHIPNFEDSDDSYENEISETIDQSNKYLLHKISKMEAEINILRNQKEVIQCALTKKQLKTTLPFETKDMTLIHDEFVQLVEQPICCWWCSYEIEKNETKYYLPENKHVDTYTVSGCYCSPNCALSYNLSLKDTAVKYRSLLLNNLYRRTDPLKSLYPAPDKFLLQKFGGNMSYDEFRRVALDEDILNDEKIIMIGQNYYYQLKSNDHESTNYEDCNPPHIGSNLVLQRTKPLKNTYCSMTETFGLVESSFGD